MPHIPETWLDAQIVNTTGSGQQSQPDITQLANGNILVTWTSSHATGDGSPAGTEVFAQLFDPLGTPLGSEFRINAVSLLDNERDSDIVALPDGGFLVIYHDDDLSGNGASNIRLERFDATGTGVAEDSLVVNDGVAPALPNYANPRGACSSATSVMVVYDVIDGGNSGIFGRIYNPTTNTYGAEFLVMSAGTSQNADIAVLSNGNYVIATEVDAADDAIRFRIFNAAGGQVAGAFFVTGTDTDTFADRDVSVTALAGGGFVLVWTSTDGNDTDVLFRVYDNAGVSVSNGQIDGGLPTDDNNEPVVVGLADGSFVVIYDNQDANVLTASYRAANGNFLGSLDMAANAYGISAVALADGRMAITYMLDPEDTIRMEILDTRNAVNALGVYAPDQWQVGTVGDDVFTAAALADITHGWTGNDTITEVNAGGQQQYFGDDGNDTLIVVSPVSDDLHDGGAGIDTIIWTGAGAAGLSFDLAAGTATDGVLIEQMLGFENLTGTADNDTILGTADSNTLAGAGSNDTISGGGSADVLDGGDGNDTLSGGSGSDTLEGGTGNDRLTGGTSSDTYIVDALADLIIETASQGDDRVLARASFVLAADDSIETMQTTSFAGVDAINLTGNALAQDIIGNAGANTLEDGAGAADVLRGSLGDDTYVIRTAGTAIVEGVGEGTADRVLAAVSFALAADDNIEVMQTTSFAGVGAINLTGNALAQTIIGNAGANALRGAAGNDTLTGGAGADDFIFNTALGATNIDGITDFVAGLDDMLLRDTMFAGIGIGALAANEFHAGASGQAQTVNTRIIYETDNGNLWYDADGTGGILRVQFGDLAAGLGITAGDFAVF